MAPVRARPNSGGGDETLGVSALVIVLAVISVALRFYTRIFTRQGLQLDDWLILAAVITTLVTAILLLWGNAVDPDGLWVSENTDPDYVYTVQDVFYLKLAFGSSVLYFTIAGATKLGILCMYYRIFHVSSAFRYQLFISAGLVVGWWVGCTVATLTNCIPLEWSWINSLADPRYCFNYNIFWMASGVCEIFLDVLILTLPISVVVRLQFSMKQKLTVSGIFLLGGFVVITGLVKVILGYPQGSRVPSYSNTEVWTTVHTGIAIVCSNLPILNPLLIRILKSSFVAKMTTFWPNRGGHRQSYSVVDASGSGHYDPDFSGRTARSNAAARSMSDIHRLPKIVQTSESEQIMPRRRSQDAQLRENNLDWGGERELLPFIQTPSSETSLTAQVADFPEHGNNRIESQ